MLLSVQTSSELLLYAHVLNTKFSLYDNGRNKPNLFNDSV